MKHKYSWVVEIRKKIDVQSHNIARLVMFINWKWPDLSFPVSQNVVKELGVGKLSMENSKLKYLDQKWKFFVDPHGHPFKIFENLLYHYTVDCFLFLLKLSTEV